MKNSHNEVIEISPLDIWMYIKSCAKSILLSIIFLSIIGATYYYYFQKNIYITYAELIIEFDNEVLTKKQEELIIDVNKRNYFSRQVELACKTSKNQEPIKLPNDKVKIFIEQKSKTIVVESQAESVQAGRDCIIAIMDEINNKNYAKLSEEDELTRLELDLVMKIYTFYEGLTNSKQDLKLNEEKIKYILKNDINLDFIVRAPLKIKKLEKRILEYKNKKLINEIKIYSEEYPINKKPLTLISACLVLGVILGLLGGVVKNKN